MYELKRRIGRWRELYCVAGFKEVVYTAYQDGFYTGIYNENKVN
jgi:hypothetical protein